MCWDWKERIQKFETRYMAIVPIEHPLKNDIDINYEYLVTIYDCSGVYLDISLCIDPKAWIERYSKRVIIFKTACAYERTLNDQNIKDLLHSIEEGNICLRDTLKTF